mgnify:CR=1 FL=1
MLFIVLCAVYNYALILLFYIKNRGSPVGRLGIIMVINYSFSKKDKRLINAFRTRSLRIKGWVQSMLWAVGMVMLLPVIR